MFTVSCTSDKIWNITDLVGFLVANQHRSIVLDIVPEAICLTNLGLYDLLDKFEFEQVRIKTWNPLEQHPRYTIDFHGPSYCLRKNPDIDPDLHDWNLKRRFLCFYHRPTAARLGLAAHLHAHYADTSLIHFSTDDLVDFELDKLLQWDVASTAEAAKLLPELPLLLGSPKGYTKFTGYDYTDPLTQVYRDILVDVVVENHVAGKTFFPTEKTIRAMLLKKPFVVFGSRDFLAYLRQIGFRTFADFWDEDYDGYEGADRLLKIKALIDNLAQIPMDKLQAMYWDMQYTLDHNYNLLQSQTYTKHTKEI